MSSKQALCVGIDEYRNPANNLTSCIADTERIQCLLLDEYGFDEVASLRNSQATVSAVTAAVEKLLTDVKPSDRIVFFFSGHGYQRLVESTLEEVLVLYDGFFPDDLLSSLSQKAPPGVFTCLLDCCFSGGMEKAFEAAGGIEVAPSKRWIDSAMPRLSLPAGAVAARRKRFSPSTKAASGVGSGLIAAKPSDEAGQNHVNGLVLAACSENETASAKTSFTKGLSAFTYALTEGLENLGSTASSHSLVAFSQRHLSELSFSQTPVIKAPIGQPLGALPFLLLDAPRHELVQLSASTATPLPLSSPYFHSQFQSFLHQFNKEIPVTHSNNKSLLLDLFGLVSSQLPDAIPLVLSALSKDYTPTHVPMEPAGQDKFFTALVSAAAAIAPIALSAAVTVAPPLIDAAVRTAPQIIPLIASAFSGDPQKKSWIAAASNRAHNPATGNNSLDLLGIIGSVSPESLPQIMQAVGASYQMGSSIPGGGYRPWQNGGGLGPQITPPLS